MKLWTLISMFMLVSCATREFDKGQQHQEDEVITLQKIKSDVEFDRNFDSENYYNIADETLKKLTEEERIVLLTNYYRYYQFASQAECQFPVDERPLVGVMQLNLQTVHFSPTFADSIVAGSTDLSSEWESYKIITPDSMTEEVESILKLTKKHPEDSMGHFSALLVRAGKKGDVRYFFCLRTPDEKAICTEDRLISSLVNIENRNAFCSWLAERNPVEEADDEELLKGILGILVRLKKIS